jgi:ribosomal-protein-alanine N-acetyltransferase
MGDVLQIERESFQGPWTEDDFLGALRNRNVIGMVAEHGGKVVGFLIFALHKAKLHILNFAVNPSWRRQGVGGQMVGKLSNYRRKRIALEVRETNLPALLFLRSQGFRAVKLLRGHYQDSGEDAIRMQHKLESEN